MAAQDLPTKSRDEYKRLAHIGRGTFGDVFLCEHAKTGEHVCMKEVDLSFLSSDERMRCLTEVTLLKQLPSHANIVGYREAFWAPSTEVSEQVLVLILEYADGGDLEQYLRSLDHLPIPQEESCQIFLQLARAVGHLHSYRVLHRDLKCSNVFLFRSGRVVLGDFGTSKLLPPITGSDHKLEAQGLTSTVVGSPLYISPELLEGEPHGFATDIWSLGCVLYEMMSGGKSAFAAPSYPAVMYRITQGEYDPLEPALVASEVRNLIARMLQKAPQNRPCIAEVLQSAWLDPRDTTEVKRSESHDHERTGQQDLGSNVMKQSLIKSAAELVHPAESFTLPAPVDMSTYTEVSASQQIIVSPPPAPVISSRGQPQRPRRETDQLRSRVASPLIRFDVQPPPPPVLPSRKNFSAAASNPFKHHNSQQRSAPGQASPALEIRGVHITGIARHKKRAAI